jgi:hypothetical protein
VAAGNTEVSLDYGSDFILDPTGDLTLARDAAVSTATIQRLTRLVLTSPTANDAFGNPISIADDIFNPKWGAGLRAAVDGAFSASNIQTIRSLVLSELAQDSAVASTPSPIVDVQLIDYRSATLSIVVWTTTGQQLVLPTIPLTASGA